MTTFLQKLSRSPLHRKWVSQVRGWFLRATVSGLDLGTGTTIGKGVVLETYRSLPGIASIEIGDNSTLEDFVRLETWGGSLSIGSNVHVGSATVLYGHGGITIGDDCLIAMHCRILSSNHAIPPQGTPIRSQADEPRPVSVGRDVWIGAGTTILGGVTIGDGAVIGAGSVVTRDIPAGSVCFGVPAHPVRYREGAEKADAQ